MLYRLLIFAATDTTASILMTAFQLLAQCQDIQDRIKAEILAAHYQYGEEIPYEQLMALPLLDAVCRETLRLYVNKSSHLVVRPYNQWSNPTSRHPPVPYLIRQWVLWGSNSPYLLMLVQSQERPCFASVEASCRQGWNHSARSLRPNEYLHHRGSSWS